MPVEVLPRSQFLQVTQRFESGVKCTPGTEVTAIIWSVPRETSAILFVGESGMSNWDVGRLNSSEDTSLEVRWDLRGSGEDLK